MRAGSGGVAVAWRELVALSLALVVLLSVAAVGYGYHRDELYFIVIGADPAWGYVDQPPLVPLLTHAMASLTDWLWLFRLPASLAAGGTVLLTGLLARELGAGRGGQVLAAACTAVAAITLGAGHLMGTTIFDILAWSLVTWAVVVGTVRDERLWLVAGAAAGVGLQVKSLMGFLLVALAVGVVLAGPRRLLRSPWLWGGATVALLLWLPNALWQQANGWPQLELARAISDGSSGTSADRWVFLPFQLVLVSPFLAPVWLAGLWRLLRDPRLRAWRFLGVAYLVLLVVFLATGAKPYYLAGLFPVLLAAGAEPVLAWVRGRPRGPALVGGAMAASLVVASVLFLPAVPEQALTDTPVVAVNYDAGETVAWPRFARVVAGVRAELVVGRNSEETAVLASNYGQLGALARFTPDVPVYSGHNALWSAGPPPESVRTVVAVGFEKATLRAWFDSVRPVGRFDNGLDLDNDEQGARFFVCTRRLGTWTAIWPQLRRLG